MPEVLRYYYETALIVKLNKSLSTPLADILVLKRKSMKTIIYLMFTVLTMIIMLHTFMIICLPCYKKRTLLMKIK